MGWYKNQELIFIIIIIIINVNVCRVILQMFDELEENKNFIFLP